MYFRSTYDNEFEDLIMYLRGKYPDKLFDLEGIGKQTDMAAFSKNFFTTKSNIADKSVDSNANVDDTSVIAYESELTKPFFRFNSLYLIWKYIKQYYGLENANNIIEQQIVGDFYVNDLCGINKPYCYNFSTYDVMLKGLPFVKKVKSKIPKHLTSFIGQLIHFSVYASNSILGAVGLADILIVSSYYVDKLLKENPDVTKKYLWKQIKQEFQSFIFSCNQPFRGGVQSGFYNVSLFDDNFLNKFCGEYIFPDGSSPNKDTVKKLQNIYVDLMNETLRESPITFPVTTACFSVDEDRNILDEEFLDKISKQNQEFGFINIYCGKTSTLSSCCRLRSEMATEYFNQFGAGGTKIGSLGVVTINLPKAAVRAEKDETKFFEILENLCTNATKINNIKRLLLKKRIDNDNLPLYTLGFMDLKTQYSTVGLCGINEMCNFMGYDILNKDGQDFVIRVLNFVNDLNDKASKKYNAPHNTEQVPAENSSIKMAQKDKLLGFQKEYDLYSNQFIPLTTKADLLDRIKLQGLFDSRMSGGAICHLNVETIIEDYTLIKDLIKASAKMGVVYFAINYVLQECSNGHMTVGNTNSCSICSADIVGLYSRVVGFLTPIKNWHQVRREQDFPNRQWYGGSEVKS